jgi:hypothetical protein
MTIFAANPATSKQEINRFDKLGLLASRHQHTGIILRFSGSFCNDRIDRNSLSPIS